MSAERQRGCWTAKLMDNPKIVGLVLGLAIGIVLVWLGVWQAVVVGVLGSAGWLIGKFVAGELSIVDALLDRFLESRRGGRP